MSFSHLDPGTPENLWADAFAARTLPDASQAFARLVVVSAHPDDETLGVAGLVHLAARRGAEISLVVVTDGENSHPDSVTTTPARLRDIRRAEVREALGHLANYAEVRFLGVPDGGIAAQRDQVAAELDRLLDDDDRETLVVSPWMGDRHGDHRVVGEIARAAAERAGARHRAYPIWLWHWGDPDDAPWDAMERLDLDDDAVAAKAAALASHPSQTAPLSSQPGDEPVLHAGMQAHFARRFEVLVAQSAGSTSRGYFDRFYATGDDPWGFDSRWYEARKRAVLLAALPRRWYSAALELGCSTGALTVELAARAGRVHAVDFADAALAAARERLAGHDIVTFERATLPRDWPAGSFELIVFSEIGYYLDASDLAATVERMTTSLEPGGHLVACHWRHPVPDGPLDGDAVHAALRAAPGLVPLVRHEEDDFVLEVFGMPPVGSVAAETGLLS